MVSVRRLGERQRASIRRGDFSDYAVEARDGPIGRLSAASSDALAEETLVVELGPLLFGELVLVPLAAVREIDLDTETVFLSLSRQQVQAAPRLKRSERSD